MPKDHLNSSRRYRRLQSAAVALLLAGCSAVPLERRWRPLTQLVNMPGQKENRVTTVGRSVYVAPGHVPPEWIMIHEHVHAVRQKRDGVFWWVLQYLFNPSFARYEEELAFAEQWSANKPIRQRARAVLRRYHTFWGMRLWTDEEIEKMLNRYL